MRTLHSIAARATEKENLQARIRELEETLHKINTLASVRGTGGETGRLGVIAKISAAELCPLISKQD